ncbi:hypothetical protein [Gehongia tenuis]|uniref:Uncharacterized protein n=1 Tax=Gehongia tenuis TaxID=2763655 RepID=A0A926D317_9FIRM|nr:hypothetical protein [Gehongia tenuis]MBC8530559.1 hypothetical protein [Gehongia tenuis]
MRAVGRPGTAARPDRVESGWEAGDSGKAGGREKPAREMGPGAAGWDGPSGKAGGREKLAREVGPGAAGWDGPGGKAGGREKPAREMEAATGRVRR